MSVISILTLLYITCGLSFRLPANKRFMVRPFKSIPSQSNTHRNELTNTPSRMLLMASSMGSNENIDNLLKPEKFTEKAWDCVAKLPQYADKYATQYIEATLVLKGLLEEGQAGLAQRIISKAGMDAAVIDRFVVGFNDLNHS